jgi:hypothetical protein
MYYPFLFLHPWSAALYFASSAGVRASLFIPLVLVSRSQGDRYPLPLIGVHTIFSIWKILFVLYFLLHSMYVAMKNVLADSEQIQRSKPMTGYDKLITTSQ